MINKEFMTGAINQLQTEVQEFKADTYLTQIKEYWKAKRKKKKVCKPKPKFTESYIKNLSKNTELVNYWGKTTPEIKKELKKFNDLVDVFLESWNLYKTHC